MEYRAPVDRLLTLGQPQRHEATAGCSELGLTRDHVPDLIRMATDERLNSANPADPAVWAPVHAWRALGELRATEVIEPLFGLFRRIDENDDDWVGEDLPRTLAAIGPAAVPPATAFLANPAHGEYARAAAVRVIRLVAQQHPDTRSDGVARLTNQLGDFLAQSPALNAFLISALLDLRAVESAPVLERAFASGRVDETVTGDWEDAAIELGLQPRREAPRKPNQLTAMGGRLRSAFGWPEPARDEYDNPVNAPAAATTPAKVGRNDPCPCGSGRKFKKCCGV